jgi:hypothetical protein
MRMLRYILFIEPQVLRTDRRISLLNKFYFIYFFQQFYSSETL